MPSSPRKTLKFIGCEIIYREACYLAATGPHRVDIEFLRKGLHDLETPDMVARVQAAIDAVDPARGYEAVLLGYARCNDGLVGVRAGDIPLVVPRAHDCITFFFGGRRAYADYFARHPGTYYKTTGWCERNAGEGAGEQTQSPGARKGVMGNLGLDQSYEEMVAKYGEDAARYIREQLTGWQRNYDRFLYLKMGLCEEEDYIDQTRREADSRGWRFDLRNGGWGLLRKLFYGDWDHDFVIVQPGRRIIARNDDRVLDASE